MRRNIFEKVGRSGNQISNREDFQMYGAIFQKGRIWGEGEGNRNFRSGIRRNVVGLSREGLKG